MLIISLVKIKQTVSNARQAAKNAKIINNVKSVSLGSHFKKLKPAPLKFTVKTVKQDWWMQLPLIMSWVKMEEVGPKSEVELKS